MFFTFLLGAKWHVLIVDRCFSLMTREHAILIRVVGEGG